MYREPQEVLVLHVAGLGRSTLALPALRSLRRHLPDSQITIVAGMAGAELFDGTGCANAVLGVGRLRRGTPHALFHTRKSIEELRHNTYDVAIALSEAPENALILRLLRSHVRSRLERQGGGNSITRALERIAGRLSGGQAPFSHAAHEYLRALEPLGVRPLEAEPRLNVERKSVEKLDKILSKHKVASGSLLIGVHPGSGRGKTRWPVERFASTASRLIHNYDAYVLVFGGPGERRDAKRLAAQLPLGRGIAVESPHVADFAGAVSRVSVFVANHSGPAHVAAAVGTPVVVASTLAGPSPEDLLSKHHAHIRRQRPEAIPEDEVYEAACRLLVLNRSEILSSL
jgi:ADP-heptose:LPS heptosyltransferase